MTVTTQILASGPAAAVRPRRLARPSQPSPPTSSMKRLRHRQRRWKSRRSQRLVGPYAGVQLGYGFAGEPRTRPVDNAIDTDGFVGGAFAGYNCRGRQGIVAGVEGRYRLRRRRGQQCRHRRRSRASKARSAPASAMSCQPGHPALRDGRWRRQGAEGHRRRSRATATRCSAGRPARGADVMVTEQSSAASNTATPISARDVHDRPAARATSTTTTTACTFGIGMKF